MLVQSCAGAPHVVIMGFERMAASLLLWLTLTGSTTLVAADGDAASTKSHDIDTFATPRSVGDGGANAAPIAIPARRQSRD